MTQKHLAEAAEVSVRTVMRAERDVEISDENMRAICAVLEIDAAALPRIHASAPALPQGDTSHAALLSRAMVRATRLVDGLRRRRPWLAAAKTAAVVAASLYLAEATFENVRMLSRDSDGWSALLEESYASLVAMRLNLIAEKLSSAAPMPADRELLLDKHDLREGEHKLAHPLCRQEPFGEKDGGGEFPLYWGETCTRQHILFNVARFDAAGFKAYVGRLTPAEYRTVLGLLARDPSLSIRVAASGDYMGAGFPQDGGPSLLWFDPREVKPGNLDVPSGLRGLFIHIEPKGERQS